MSNLSMKSIISAAIVVAKFRSVVLQGAGDGPFVMRSFANDPNITPYIDAIHAYLDARQRGLVGRGRPPNP